jgi:DNA-binding transcriptional ArsR family regulator
VTERPASRPVRALAHNPALLASKEVVAFFAARRPLLARLVEDLRHAGEGSTQHHLVIGQRGMGKTMLLQRLRRAVEEDSALARRWLPLAFPEEQYNVGRLSDLWENCLDSLIEALAERGADTSELERARHALPTEEGAARDRQALQLLTGWTAAQGRGLVLLLDNVDIIFARLKEEHWRLRDLLSTDRRLVIVGTSAGPVAPTFKYGDAFYDFFKLHELGGLGEPEARSLLSALDRPAGRVARILTDEPGRFRALLAVAAGNPRTLVLLHEVLASGSSQDASGDLELLLDRHTPLYRARLESLAPQAQQVVDALARRWDPVTAGELARGLRLDVNIVSSQLSRLAREGVVEKVEYPGSRAGFQVAERLLNCWYLMRAGRRERQRLLWLVEFLQLHHASRRPKRRARAAGGSVALGLARRLIGEGEDVWPDLLLLCGELVLGGRAAEMAALLEDRGRDQRWRPLHVALQAAAARSRAPLLRVAPEVRAPAVELLAQLGVELDALTAP